MSLLANHNPVHDAFGTIFPPAELQPFIVKGGGTGAGAINLFLDNLVILIYIIAAVVFVFMILWGAFEWVLSGGDKEKLQNAQRRLTHAFIGIILFAIAFALLALIGTFTGFKFFK